MLFLESAKKRSPQSVPVPPKPQLKTTVPLPQKTGRDDQKTKGKLNLERRVVMMQVTVILRKGAEID